MRDRNIAAGLEAGLKDFLKLSCRKYIEPDSDDDDVEIPTSKKRQKVKKPPSKH